MKILSGNNSKALAEKIALHLSTPLVSVDIKRFSDHEMFIEILESVRGHDVFIIQSTSDPVNDSLMELLIIIDALKRSSASRITAVMPYFGYSRQDRKSASRTSISAKLVANLLTTAGASRVLTVDLHAGQIQGFFDIPCDDIMVYKLFAGDIKTRNFRNPVIVSPDVGGVKRARQLAELLGLNLCIIDKRRPEAGKTEVMNVIGEVQGATCILLDDIVDSGGTLIHAASALKEKGASKVFAYATHGVLSGNALSKIEISELEDITISDSIAAKISQKIRTLTLSPLLAQTIQHIHGEQSVEGIFSHE